MPTETVLVQVVTAANLAGIEQAKGSLLGLQAQTIAMTAAFTLLVVVGKAAVENAKKQEEAADQLTQAYQTQGTTLDANQAVVADFIRTNASFIKDQYDTQQAMAQVLRAGYDNAQMLRIMSDALDLAAINHSNVSDEAQKLVVVLAGGGKVLKQYGITTEEYNKIIKDKTIPQGEKVAQVLALIEAHTKGAKEQTDHLEASQNRLNIAWETFTGEKGGPALTALEKLNDAATTAVELVDLLYQLLGKITTMSPGNLLKISQILNGLLNPIGAVQSILDLNSRAGRSGGPAPGTAAFGKGGRASGGPVEDGDYLVGEQGPELRHFGAAGSIIPNGALGGGGGGNHFHFHDAVYADGPGLDRLARALIAAGRRRPGT